MVMVLLKGLFHQVTNTPTTLLTVLQPFCFIFTLKLDLSHARALPICSMYNISDRLVHVPRHNRVATSTRMTNNSRKSILEQIVSLLQSSR